MDATGQRTPTSTAAGSPEDTPAGAPAPDAKPAPGAIVVGVDGSPSSNDAITWAAEQATRDHRSLALVHAYTLDTTLWVDSMGADRDIMKVMADDGRRLLLEAADHAHRTHPDLEVHEWLYHADARSALLEASRDASLLVVGSRGRGGFRGLLIGSVSRTALHHAACTVAVVRDGH